MPDTIELRIQELQKQQSVERGVGLQYLLSGDFTALAQDLTGQLDPDFHDMRDPFFKDAGLGAKQICPRDRLEGAALVDTLPRLMRGRCTHFLSWSWKYSLSTVQSSLRQWLAQSDIDGSSVFFFMCFFCNNQHRILIKDGPPGSLDLQNWFETRLIGVGRLVALLDDWHKPTYLTRIWTIFEQYTASKLGVPVEIIMPETAHNEVLMQIREGESGITRV